MQSTEEIAARHMPIAERVVRWHIRALPPGLEWDDCDQIARLAIWRVARNAHRIRNKIESACIRAIINALNDMIRKQKEHVERLPTVRQVPAGLHDSGRAVADQVLGRMEFERIRDAIAELPAKQRDICVRYYLQEKTIIEIGAEIGLDKSNVYRHIVNGTQTLRQTLKESGAAARN